MMAFNDRSLDDYIDVPQRIADFRAKHPGGALQPHAAYEIVRVPNGWCRQCIGRQQIQKKDKTWIKCPRCGGSGVRAESEPQEDVFIAYTATAYRGADDAKPGIGMAWEPFPGQTPYTAGSELMNAETSAWGRAIVAALASDSKRGVSSREEVRNRAAEQDGDSWENAKPASRNGQQQQAPPDASQWEKPPGAAETDQAWLDKVTEQAATFSTDDEGRVLWRRVNEKVEARGCTAADGDRLKELIRERHKELAAEPAGAAS